MRRIDLNEAVLEFASDPQGVFYAGGGDRFMQEWFAGQRFPRSFVSLRGLVCRVAQDAGLDRTATDTLLDEVFLPFA